MEKVTWKVQPFRSFLRGNPENPGGEYVLSLSESRGMSSENSNICDYEKFRSELRNRREEWGVNGVKNLTGTLESLPIFAVYLLQVLITVMNLHKIPHSTF